MDTSLYLPRTGPSYLHGCVMQVMPCLGLAEKWQQHRVLQAAMVSPSQHSISPLPSAQLPSGLAPGVVCRDTESVTGQAGRTCS